MRPDAGLLSVRGGPKGVVRQAHKLRLTVPVAGRRPRIRTDCDDRSSGLHLVVSGVAYYFIAMSVVRGVLVTLFLGNLSRAAPDVHLSVDPNHPDGAGGWGSLGEYLLGLFIGVATAIANLSLVLYSNLLEDAWKNPGLSAV
jgi:hypothetical protein